MGAAIWFIFSIGALFLGLYTMIELTGLDAVIRPLLAIIFFVLFLVLMFFAVADAQDQRAERSPAARQQRQREALRAETGQFVRRRARRRRSL